MPVKTTTLGQELRLRREAKGFSLIDLMLEIRSYLPRSKWVSNETLRRIENEAVPEDQADPVVVAAVAEVLGCSIADLSPVVAEAADQVRRLLSRTPPRPPRPPRKRRISGLAKQPSAYYAIAAA